MILFCDENIPQAIAQAIRPLVDFPVVHLLEELDQATPDEAIFLHVSSKGSAFLLTQDAKIRRRPHQLEALKQAGLGAFVVSGTAQRTMPELAILIIRALPAIRTAAGSTRRPFVFSINDRSRLDQLI